MNEKTWLTIKHFTILKVKETWAWIAGIIILLAPAWSTELNQWLLKLPPEIVHPNAVWLIWMAVLFLIAILLFVVVVLFLLAWILLDNVGIWLKKNWRKANRLAKDEIHKNKMIREQRFIKFMRQTVRHKKGAKK